MRDTIFALASAPGRGAVAVVRLSGGEAGALAASLTGSLPRARRAAVRTLTFGGEIIDEALVLWFPGPASFTGEDVAEFQVHGGPAVLEAVTDALLALGARPAAAGEFTRRAFEAGRLELSQAEAIADLVDAETQAQRRQALAHLGGAQHRRSEAWRETLMTALAYLEAQIDFPDEEVPPDIGQKAFGPLKGLLQELEAVLGDFRGERVRNGLKIAIIGPPNAGKSSLLNALVGRDAAIVTPIAGTTRDVIEVEVVLSGYKATLADTAGLRATDDIVEQEGVRRAQAWAETADLRIFAWDREDAEASQAYLALVRPGDFLVATKADQFEDAEAGGRLGEERGLVGFSTSVFRPETIGRLERALGNWAAEALAGAEAPAITRERHRRLLEEGRGHLARALERSGREAELVAEDVRLAARAMEALSGRIGADAVLDRVFASFCIGK